MRGRIAWLLLFVGLVLLGQTVWAAGYKSPRTLGAWHLRQTLGPAAALAPTLQPLAAAAVSLEDADYWQQAQGGAGKAATAGSSPAVQQAAELELEQQDEAVDDVEGGLSWQPVQMDMTEEEEAAEMAEAEARLAQDFAAVSGLDAEQPGPAAASIAGGRGAPAQQQPAAAATPIATPAASPAGASPLQGMPYNLDQLPDAEALFKAHREWQAAVLQQKKQGVPAVKVETGIGHGLGNRLPGIGTGFVLAVLTGRLFFLQSTVHEHLQLPLPCVWQDYASLYAGVDRCDLGHFAKFVNPDLNFCGGPTENKTATLLQQPCQFDYMLPMLQINPTLKPYLEKFFPDGEVFSRVARYLFSKPTPVLEAALKPYKALSKDCLVGMHLRTRKTGTSASPENFGAVARAVAVARPGNVFVAADADVFQAVQDALPGRKVWWNAASAAELQRGNTTHAGNPGTELSVMTDLMLLSRCKSIVLTPASSIGPIAAALAGGPPVYATHGTHAEPFTNPWFWRSVTTEPCFVKAAEAHSATTDLARRFRREHPLFVYHSQCHFEARAVGVPAATWECSAENCREW